MREAKSGTVIAITDVVRVSTRLGVVVCRRDAANLKPGDKVRLSGDVITGRLDGVSRVVNV